jgi:hypothetical protein
MSNIFKIRLSNLFFIPRDIVVSAGHGVGVAVMKIGLGDIEEQVGLVYVYIM